MSTLSDALQRMIDKAWKGRDPAQPRGERAGPSPWSTQDAQAREAREKKATPEDDDTGSRRPALEAMHTDAIGVKSAIR